MYKNSDKYKMSLKDGKKRWEGDSHENDCDHNLKYIQAVFWKPQNLENNRASLCNFFFKILLAVLGPVYFCMSFVTSVT